MRFQSLDGWRGVSIILVLAGHLLPLGPKVWTLNGAVASSGMAIFFILSGFLITNLLHKNQRVVPFLIRRSFRIVPLAWLALFITLFAESASIHTWVSSFFFYANLPPIGLVASNGHFWSLCLEMQFYFFVAFLVAIFKQKGLNYLPLICLLVTALRVFFGVEMSIVSYFRADEILAGCWLALIYISNRQNLKDFIGQLNPFVLMIALIASAHESAVLLQYFRPYIAMLLVGSTLLTAQKRRLDDIFNSRILIYVATISYALYVIHGGLAHTWIGTGDTLEKYLKRPILFAITFGLAHISTFYYEKHFVILAKRISNRMTKIQ